MNVIAHKCKEPNLACGECVKRLCGECATMTPLGVRCNKCVPQHWRSTVVPVNASAMLRLQLAATMFSLMLAKFLSMFTFCFT